MTVEGARALVEQSLKAGVSRFVFFSSVKAMGEGGETCLDETRNVSLLLLMEKPSARRKSLYLSLTGVVCRQLFFVCPWCMGLAARVICHG